jgi:hypothetical protein
MPHCLKLVLITLCGLLIAMASFSTCTDVIWAASDSNSDNNTISESDDSSPTAWYDGIDIRWGGRIRATGRVSRANDDTFLAPVASGALYDGSADFRLINETFFSDQVYFEGAYELIFAGGDTRRAREELRDIFPNLPSGPLFAEIQLNDDRRLFDLTSSIHETDSYVLFQRLDRLYLAMLPEWGSLRIGRQALTWGNGLIFNPMDLFNPFPPAAIDRDYKVGDDMAAAQVPLSEIGDVQALYVPRRNPQTDNVEWDQSALAGKLHVAAGTTEVDIMAAKNYEDFVAGIGTAGYLGDAAWRLDTTWTWVVGDREGGKDNFLSLVANLDYSWIWGGKNFYGFIEYYYNGLGEDDYQEAITDPEIIERLSRGNLFVLGTNYLSGQIQVELHPLLSVYLTSINNVEDPSGILQPRAIWDIQQNLQMTVGANVFWGVKGTEYGGFIIPGTNLRSKQPDNAYLWFIYYF